MVRSRWSAACLPFPSPSSPCRSDAKRRVGGFVLVPSACFAASEPGSEDRQSTYMYPLHYCTLVTLRYSHYYYCTTTSSSFSSPTTSTQHPTSTSTSGNAFCSAMPQNGLYSSLPSETWLRPCAIYNTLRPTVVVDGHSPTPMPLRHEV